MGETVEMARDRQEKHKRQPTSVAGAGDVLPSSQESIARRTRGASRPAEVPKMSGAVSPFAERPRVEGSDRSPQDEPLNLRFGDFALNRQRRTISWTQGDGFQLTFPQDIDLNSEEGRNRITNALSRAIAEITSTSTTTVSGFKRTRSQASSPSIAQSSFGSKKGERGERAESNAMLPLSDACLSIRRDASLATFGTVLSH